MTLNLLRALCAWKLQALVVYNLDKMRYNEMKLYCIQELSSEEEVNLMERGWSHQFAGVSGSQGLGGLPVARKNSFQDSTTSILDAGI
jgi:hypothetical protein